MRNLWILIAVCILLLPAASAVSAKEFLGVPLVPEGKIVKETKSRLEMNSPLSHEEILDFYKERLEDLENIKYRDWEDSTYIEDDGARKWHSITIAKREGDKPQIVIVKDNWTWIISTLLLRFIAVFVVLLCLFVGLKLSGSVLSRVVGKSEK